MTMLKLPMRDALRLVRAGKVTEATKLIKGALTGRDESRQSPIDVEFEIIDRDTSDFSSQRSSGRTVHDDATSTTDEPQVAQAESHRSARSARFEAGVFANASGLRSYKLWSPADASSRTSTSLIVMLHGCTQDADDFAIGTRMNALAERGGFHVLYPIQSASANFNRCWQWFRAEDQHRDAGEPSIIADLTRKIVADHAIDPARVFVAGLSAGAAMAVILGRTYPDVFAAVGSHSGLPYGCADNVPSAMAAMSGQPRSTRSRPGNTSNDSAQPRPGIAIHGNRDTTVVPANSDALVAQWAKAYADRGRPLGATAVRGPTSDCSRFATANGEVLIEQWTIPGAGHAWSGGDARGTYAVADGPDASQLMVDFFTRIGSSPAR
ncbi:MAG: PHB depolymerase family esterase [Dokdonella sp.]|uniref:extracellular catalytic domain type 1 short-chain-length polyhydroxyalkanoate depolymerase n=1 Tax=Dokdonella sp. TaxID=2291710 RepID=UPI003262F974